MQNKTQAALFAWPCETAANRKLSQIPKGVNTFVAVCKRVLQSLPAETIRVLVAIASVCKSLLELFCFQLRKCHTETSSYHNFARNKQ
jgi:hypothetical protein